MRIKNVRMTEELFDRLRRESERTGASGSEILRRAALEYLEKREKTAKERAKAPT
jgi:predicted DNA-binding protein